jgi:hypothetical protein
MFVEFREGKICRQRNYDCFEAWYGRPGSAAVGRNSGPPMCAEVLAANPFVTISGAANQLKIAFNDGPARD